MTLPLPCVILAIDQAAVSGWAIWAQGKLMQSGYTKTIPQQAPVVADALELAALQSLPLVVVFEDHSDIPLQARTRQDQFRRGETPERNTATILGMGAARGRWETTLALAGVPRRRWLKVPSKTWRHLQGITGDGNECKRIAKQLAARHAGRHIGDHNQAEAICIGWWATYARTVAAVLPKRRANG